ncbi:hypothetical protein ACRDNQ_05915 [Palleronia sp. KMU-117]|uniref:hypothetical protein n=1 Tax=Palleronia sp. KMU-117 TaxID=3434108 RepID=UPI003D74A65A
MVVIDFRTTLISPEEFRRIVGIDKHSYAREITDNRIERSGSGSDWQTDFRFHTVFDVINYALLRFLESINLVERELNLAYRNDFCDELARAFEDYDDFRNLSGKLFLSNPLSSSFGSGFQLPELAYRCMCILIDWSLRRIELDLKSYFPYRVGWVAAEEMPVQGYDETAVVFLNPVSLWQEGLLQRMVSKLSVLELVQGMAVNNPVMITTKASVFAKARRESRPMTYPRSFL